MRCSQLYNFCVRQISRCSNASECNVWTRKFFIEITRSLDSLERRIVFRFSHFFSTLESIEEAEKSCFKLNKTDHLILGENEIATDSQAFWALLHRFYCISVADDPSEPQARTANCCELRKHRSVFNNYIVHLLWTLNFWGVEPTGRHFRWTACSGLSLPNDQKFWK